MSKQISEETEKFTKFLNNLEEYSESSGLGSNMESESKKLVENYGSDLSWKSLKNYYKDWEANTPEEIELLEICKSRTFSNVKFWTGVGFIASAAFTIFYSEYLPFKPRMITQAVGIFLGGLYGTIVSIRPNFTMIDKLGPEYALGRLARDEILQWGDEETAMGTFEEKEDD